MVRIIHHEVNALTRLGQVRVPAIPGKLPKTLRQVLDEHLSLELDKFEELPKHEWGTPIRMAYSKRQYLFKAIQRRAKVIRGNHSVERKMEKAVDFLEQERERLELSLNKFFLYLKGNDDKTIQRKKRGREDDESGI